MSGKSGVTCVKNLFTRCFEAGRPNDLTEDTTPAGYVAPSQHDVESSIIAMASVVGWKQTQSARLHQTAANARTTRHFTAERTLAITAESFYITITPIHTFDTGLIDTGTLSNCASLPVVVMEPFVSLECIVCRPTISKEMVVGLTSRLH